MANKLIAILPATAAVTIGPAISLLSEDTRNTAYQATVQGSGSVSATVIIEVSNDRVGWITDGTATLVLSGTDVASAGFVSTATWAYSRARLTSISASSSVSVLASVGP